MAHPHPFRFGVVAWDVPSGDAIRTLARRAESLGYATFAVDDHMFRPYGPFAALTAAADATTTIRVGTAVLANDFRHPVVMAKEAASLDALSGGRLELGLGTGYWRDDYALSGIPFDPPGVRVERLAEAVRVVKGAFGARPFSFAGRHYTVRDLDGQPKPVQRPHPPLLIGGGSRRILTLAAREADIVGINVRTTAAGGFDRPSLAPDAVAEKVAWVREAAGARFADLELHALVLLVAVTDRPLEAAEDALRTQGLTGQMSAADLLARPQTLLGSVAGIIEAVQERRERYGLSYLTVSDGAMEAFAPVVAALAGR